MTFKLVCETIAAAVRLETGNAMTGQQVFEYSPTGELFMLWEWYPAALVIIEKHATKRRG